MSEKVEFKGDVAQAVMGDVKEAPRLNNVVTLNMAPDTPPVAAITEFQRSRISELVKELASLTGDHTLDIYRVIFTEFGIEKIRELPRDRYKDAVALIEKWIVDAKDATLPKAVVSGSLASEELKPAIREPHCLRCEEKDVNFARQQRVNLTQWMLIAVLAGSCTWLLYKWASAPDVVADDVRCYFDGRAYSIGSTIKDQSGSLRACSLGDTQTMVWGPVKKIR